VVALTGVPGVGTVSGWISSVAAATNNDTDTTTPALSGTFASIIQSIWNKIRSVANALNSYLPLAGGTMLQAAVINWPNLTTGVRNLIFATVGDNDQIAIRAGATAINAGYLELATGDDANEPIHVSQYQGIPGTQNPARRTTLMDFNGDMVLYNSLYVSRAIENAGVASILVGDQSNGFVRRVTPERLREVLGAPNVIAADNNPYNTNITNLNNLRTAGTYLIKNNIPEYNGGPESWTSINAWFTLIHMEGGDRAVQIAIKDDRWRIASRVRSGYNASQWSQWKLLDGETFDPIFTNDGSVNHRIHHLRYYLTRNSPTPQIHLYGNCFHRGDVLDIEVQNSTANAVAWVVNIYGENTNSVLPNLQFNHPGNARIIYRFLKDGNIMYFTCKWDVRT
jgi:hypothetical protein